MRKVAFCAAAVAIVAGSGGCEPCAGVAGCTGQSRIAIIGRLLDDSTGHAARGAVIDFVRVGGARLDSDSIRAKVQSDGSFELAVDAVETGTVAGDVIVRPANAAPYRMRFDSIAQVTQRDAMVLPAWSTRPSLPDLAVIYRRQGSRPQLANVDISFQRTSGVELVGIPSGEWRTTTDGSGYAQLFGSKVRPSDGGFIVGEFEIHLDPPERTIHHNVKIPVRPEFRAAPRAIFFGAGPSLNYHFAVLDRGGTGPVQGVTVSFHRDSGITTTPADWTEQTVFTGRVAVPVRAETYGRLYGTVTFTPKAPWKAYSKSVVLDAFDGDSASLYGVYGVGPGVAYYAIITENGQRKKNVAVEFQRSGGVSTFPSSFKTVSDDSGAVFTSISPAVEGNIIGDFTVRPLAPYKAFVIRNVVLQAVDADPPGGVRTLIGTWDIASPPATAVVLP